MTAIKVHTETAPTPVASYSQGLRKGPFLFLAGQGGFDVSLGRLVSDDVAEQTRQTFRNLGAVLEAAGASFRDVVSVRVFLTAHADFRAMNSVYGDYFEEPFPVRTTVFCGLGPNMKVEIDAIAVLD